MNKQTAENLILIAYDLKDRKEYLGSLRILRELSKTDKTLKKLMIGEGLI